MHYIFCSKGPYALFASKVSVNTKMMLKWRKGYSRDQAMGKQFKILPKIIG